MNDNTAWSALAALGEDYGKEVSSFLLRMAESRPYYNTSAALAGWERGLFFIWLGQRMLERARIELPAVMIETKKGRK